MKMCTRITALTIGLSLSALASAGISTASFYLDQSSALAGGFDYGRVDIVADNVQGTVQFTVTPMHAANYSSVGPNFGVDRFGFNFSGLSSTPSQWQIRMPSGWRVLSNGASSIGGFGNFVQLQRSGRGSAMAPLTFFIDLPNAGQALASNFALNSSGASTFFAAHVSGFDASGIHDHYIGGSTLVSAPVPAPGAVLLGAIGLGALTALRRMLT
ncbi:MAG: hypothetical protein U1D55_09810 [Phycisphaerae bacterium]